MTQAFVNSDSSCVFVLQAFSTAFLRFLVASPSLILIYSSVIRSQRVLGNIIWDLDLPGNIHQSTRSLLFIVTQQKLFLKPPRKHSKIPVSQGGTSVCFRNRRNLYTCLQKTVQPLFPKRSAFLNERSVLTPSDPQLLLKYIT